MQNLQLQINPACLTLVGIDPVLMVLGFNYPHAEVTFLEQGVAAHGSNTSTNDYSHTRTMGKFSARAGSELGDIQSEG